MLILGSYGQEIHEMTEMRALAMGQYGHNNQPSHHILFLFALLGEPDTTNKYVRTVMDRAYGRDYYAGDEDNGEQSAWFVLSALGLFSVAPGGDKYVLGSPIFRHVRIQNSARRINVSNRKAWLDIVALGTNEKVFNVKSILLNGKRLNSPTVSDSELWGGGMLRFVMENENELPEITVEDLEAMSTSKKELEDTAKSQAILIATLQSQIAHSHGMVSAICHQIDCCNNFVSN